jgi:hypothetical protein
LVEREFSVLVDPKPLKKKIRSIEVLWVESWRMYIHFVLKW